tara:strand:- start:1154 stop:1423 length:270 start_codon:yes stop_codon:yes gene_type:complete
MDNKQAIMVLMTIALIIWAVFFITELRAEETFEYTDEIHVRLCYETQRTMNELNALGWNVGDFEQRVIDSMKQGYRGCPLGLPGHPHYT